MLNAFAKAWSGGQDGAVGQSLTRDSDNKKPKGPTAAPSVLREDLYKAMDAAERWLATSTPGDGFSYKPTFIILCPHFPDLEIPFGCGPSEETSIIVGTITAMALELGFLDPYAGVLVVGSWTDRLLEVIKLWKVKKDPAGDRICEAIVQGINYRIDGTLMCKDFAPRMQMINKLKKVAEAHYGVGAEKTKQSNALWGSRMLM